MNTIAKSKIIVKLTRHASPPPSQRILVLIWLLFVALCAFLSIYTSVVFFPNNESTSSKQLIRVKGDNPNNKITVPRVRPHKTSYIAWLLSFPNSGTTYTLANTEHLTNRTTATNYDSEVLSNILYPVNPDADAPFLFSPHLDAGTFVLTKTHCLGYCEDCHFSQVVQDLYSFERGCRRADINIRLPAAEADVDRCRQENKYFYYNTTRIQKVVHLVRNPFDNVVARMHLGVELRKQDPARIHSWINNSNNKHNFDTEAFLRQFNDTKEGVLAWCDYLDHQFHSESSLYKADGSFRGKPSEASLRNVTIPSETMQLLKNVPCHSEWFRYVQWHNFAIELYSHQLRLVSDAHVVYFEDYTHDLRGTSARLADYLEQQSVGNNNINSNIKPLPFVSGKEYAHLFSENDKVAIAHLIHSLATPKCWLVLQRYFVDWFQEEEVDGMSNNNRHGAENVELLNPDEEEPEVMVTVNNTKIVWLLSFANSGSLLVARNIKAMTDAEVGSHYWIDGGPDQDQVFENVTHSPILMDPPGDYIPPLVLTRNQCVGYCPFCKPVEFSKAFDTTCRSVTKNINGNKTTGEYQIDLLDSAVLLVRNPFDVIRSRVNRGVFEQSEALGIMTSGQAEKVQDTRSALQEYCKIADARFVQNDDGGRPPDIPKPAGRPKATYSIVYRSLIASRRWRNRRYHCPNLLFPVDKRYSEFGRKPSFEIQEYPLDRKRITLYQSIPCYSDWLRYIQWHNYALQQIRNLPGYVVHFEKFSTDEPEKALLEVIHYLNLTAVRSPSRRYFVKDKLLHKNLYTSEESRQLAAMVREFGSDKVWELLRHYFKDEEWFDASLDDTVMSI